MKKKLLVTTLALGAGLMFTGCGGAPAETTVPEVAETAKANEEVAPAIVYKNSTHVEVYQSEDHVPDVVYMCVGSVGWATTLTRTHHGNGVAAPLVRHTGYDSICADQ